MGNPLLIVGAGGHCKSVLDALPRNTYSDIMLSDLPSRQGYSVMGISITATDDDWEHIYSSGCHNAFIAVGSVGDPSKRIRIHQRLRQIGFLLPAIIDPTAAVSESAVLAPGIFVGKKAVINAGAFIGECAIINTAAVIEHDCVLGEFVHVAPGACLAGNVEVGPKAHIGIGAVVIEGVRIGEEAVLGAGAVAVENIPAGCIAVGVPARSIKYRVPEKS
jgi:sugar O-acyltransferase (sialic acid O-acetyltransferase NeuD family)